MKLQQELVAEMKRPCVDKTVIAGWILGRRYMHPSEEFSVKDLIKPGLVRIGVGECSEVLAIWRLENDGPIGSQYKAVFHMDFHSRYDWPPGTPLTALNVPEDQYEWSVWNHQDRIRERHAY